jgi:hypothetical protein
MTHHQTRVAGVGPYQGKCACEARSEVVDHSWEADDWCRDHMDQVERARVHLYRQPSLASARDYYRRMADTADDPAHRDQWTMLADEIDLRLGNFPHDADAPLW